MCKRLLENGVAGLHFYTLNLEKSVTHILEGLGYVTELAHHGKNLPWVKVCLSMCRCLSASHACACVCVCMCVCDGHFWCSPNASLPVTDSAAVGSQQYVSDISRTPLTPLRLTPPSTPSLSVKLRRFGPSSGPIDLGATCCGKFHVRLCCVTG